MSTFGFIDDALGTNIFGDNAADRALDAQTTATNSANATLGRTYQDQKDQLAPWQNAGLRALAGLESGDFAKNLEMDPGYQFRLNEGNKQIGASMAARGLNGSGAALKALTKYGQDFASNEYNNAYNRQFQNLSQLAGFGQNASNNMVTAAGNYGNAIAGNQIGVGNAQAARQAASANASSNLLNTGLGIGAMALFSDRRLKKDIHAIDRKELAELRRVVKASTFKYKDKNMGEGEWLGVMAQDLEKSKLGRYVVETDSEGRKVINMKKATSVLFAALAEEAA